MSTTIQINQQDASDAAAFLEQFMSDQIPNGDFSQGTALRDLTIGALAAVFAYITAESNLITARQSLNTIQGTFVDAEPASLLDAVTALLSNYFITPNSGTPARGVATGHASQQVDIFIQPTLRFVRSPGVTFTVDSSTTYFIPRTDLLPVIDVNGLITDWLFQIPLVATAVGPAGNITPGLFSGFDPFSPYVTRIENEDTFGAGNPPETTAQVLARAPTAVSVRNLINSRSIEAVLNDNFGSAIKDILVIRYGDPEMVRDRIYVASHMTIHIGGSVDIFLLLDTVEMTTTGTIGGSYTRPDNIASVFYDETPSVQITGQNLALLGVIASDLVTISGDTAVPTRNGVYTVAGLVSSNTASLTTVIPGGFQSSASSIVSITDLTTTITRLPNTPIVPLLSNNRTAFTNVTPGDVLRVVAGLSGVPLEYVIESIASDNFSLFISEKHPFPAITDEVPLSYVTWTIGRISPTFNDIVSMISGQPMLNGRASRTIEDVGCLTLPGGPIMDIIEVSVTDPNPTIDAAYIDAGDGLVHFSNRVSTLPSAPVGTPLEYQVIVHNPDVAQTAIQWAEVFVNNNTEPKLWDGHTLRVRYLGLASFSAIDTFVRATDERTVAASQLVKGHYPVRIIISTHYNVVSTATTVTPPATIAQSIVDYVNSFSTVDQPMTMTGLTTYLRTTYPEIGSFDFTQDIRQMVLAAPTGDVLTYDMLQGTVPDQFVPELAVQIDGPILNLPLLGVTERTIRYIAEIDDISIQPL